jgi:hypothetical protein
MNRKLVAVLNKKVEAWKVMNALAHMTVWLVASNRDEDMEVIDYEDKNGWWHLASKLPYIILRVKNSNQIRTLRNSLIEKELPFSSLQN